MSMQVTPLPVTSIEFVKPNKCSNNRGNTPTDDHIHPSKKRADEDTGPQHSPQICKKELYHSIHNLHPNACLFTIVPKEVYGESSEPNSCATTYQQPSLSLTVVTEPGQLHSSATDDEFSPEFFSEIDDFIPVIEKVMTSSVRHECMSDEPGSTSTPTLVTDQLNGLVLPPPITEMFLGEHTNLSSQALLDKALEVFSSIAITQEDCTNIEENTRLQRECIDWYKQREGRLTASFFHEILVQRKQSDPDLLVKKLLSDVNISNIPAIKWGIEHENDAKGEYIQQMRASHTVFECTPAGLVVNPLFPHLGASPDGFTDCECCGKGLVEIKCPFSSSARAACSD